MDFYRPLLSQVLTIVPPVDLVAVVIGGGCGGVRVDVVRVVVNGDIAPGQTPTIKRVGKGLLGALRNGAIFGGIRRSQWNHLETPMARTRYKTLHQTLYFSLAWACGSRYDPNLRELVMLSPTENPATAVLMFGPRDGDTDHPAKATLLGVRRGRTQCPTQQILQLSDSPPTAREGRGMC